VAFIDKFRAYQELGGLIWRVEPICEVLTKSCGISVSPSCYYAFKKRGKSAREVEDERLSARIEVIYAANYSCYGVRKMWHALLNAGEKAARCTVGRLMKRLGLHGAARGKVKRTTAADRNANHAEDLVRRNFDAVEPDKLWVADFTYVLTRSGWCYAAFITDVFARTIVGYNVSTRMDRNMVTSAFVMALHTRARSGREDIANLIHHNDKGSQYTANDFIELLALYGVRASIGDVGDSYDNALAESVNGVYKAELINKSGPWDGHESLNLRTAEWVYWYNNFRISERNGYKTPLEVEETWYSNGMDIRKFSKTEP
jgi:putative transposase